MIGELGYLRWHSPLVDESNEIDVLVGARLVDGRVVFELASGELVEAAFSSPVDGVLRMRAAVSLGPERPSPLLVPLDDSPAMIDTAGSEIVVSGRSITARIGADCSLAAGMFRRARFAPSTRSLLAPGRLTGPTGRTGWLETVALSPDEQLFGGGESFQGPGLRGRFRRLVNCETQGAGGFDASYLNVPFFWSDHGWGVFFHTSAPTHADLGATQADAATFAIDGDELDLFILTGAPSQLLRRYMALTGLPGRLPDWALGVWMSRCSYFSAAEIDRLLDELRAAECPVDVVHVDAWMRGNLIEELTCNWAVDRDRFPHGWAANLKRRGVRVSLWHNPYVLAGTEQAHELEADNLLARGPDGMPAVTPDKPDRHLIDFTHPAAVAWWHERVREALTTEGSDAFKADFAEEIPNDARFADGRTGWELRNEYSLIYQAATHSAVAALDRLPALFCRSGTAGAQRFPCHWVGDTPSTWQGLTDALRASLSLSLSGFAFVGHDAGGHWVDGSIPRMKDAFARMDDSPLLADVDPELYVRWFQFGALSPIFRFHGTSRREPTAYPEPARSHAIEACRLRQRLRRYLERLADEAAETGAPLMRPMPLAYPHAREARDALQYLLGPDILVAPILQPGGRRLLWAPPGRWQPLLAPAPIQGPNYIQIECTLGQFPAWIREGACLSFQPLTAAR
jgi:alpha-D-xyloside xylohydrolase